MCEIKRILLNRRWIIVVLLLLVLNISRYYKAQEEYLNMPITLYSKYTNQWAKEISAEMSAQGKLELTLSKINDCESWIIANDLAERYGMELIHDDVLLKQLQTQYPDIKMKIISSLESQGDKADPLQLYTLYRWRERLEYHVNRETHVLNTIHQAMSLVNNPVYNDPETFIYRNAQKTAVDFLNGDDSNTTHDYIGDVVSSIFQYDENQFFCGSIVFVTVLFLLQPIIENIEPLLRTTQKGRARLAWYRIAVVLLISSICVVITIGSQLIVGCFLYQQPVGWLVPAQSVSILQNWTFGGRILDAILWYTALRFLNTFMIGLLSWIVLSKFDSVSWGIIVSITFFLIENTLFRRYSINDSLYWLSVYNVFHLLDTHSVMARYLNYNVLGYAINEKIIIPIVVVTTILTFIGLIFLDNRKYSYSKLSLRKLIYKTNVTHCRFKHNEVNSLFCKEYKKTFVLAKGILVFLFGLVLLGINNPETVGKTRQEELYEELVNMYLGPVTEQKSIDIMDDKDSTKCLLEKERQQGSDFYMLEYYEARYNALSLLSVRYQDLLKRQNQGIDRINLINETAYRQVYGSLGANYRNRSSIIILFMLCLLIPLIFTYEETNHMVPILFATPLGRKKLWEVKIKAMFTVVIAIWFLWAIVDFLNYNKISGDIRLLYVNMQSLTMEDPQSIDCLILVQIVKTYLGRLVILLTVGAFICVLSTYKFTHLTVASISLVIVSTPYFIHLDKEILSKMKLLSQPALYYDELKILVCTGGLLSMFLLLVAKKNWRRIRKISFD